MKLFGTLEFDFDANRIRMGRMWLKTVRPSGKQNVKLTQNVKLRPRMEEIIKVRSNKENGLMASEFRPRKVPGCEGVYISKAQVIPDIKGELEQYS